MLFHTKTQIADSFEALVAPGVSITTEGLALVSSIVQGKAHVAPATGVAGEKLVGLSYGETVIPNTAPAVFTALAAATQVLPSAPIGGTQLLVRLNGVVATAAAAPAAGAAATAPAAGSYQLTGQTLTLNAADVGSALEVVYRHALTAQQAQMLYGDGVIGQSAASLLGSTGVITNGTVYTDQYDVTADFNSNAPLRLAANGMITNTGTGALAPSLMVVEVPSQAQPMLGLRINTI